MVKFITRKDYSSLSHNGDLKIDDSLKELKYYLKEVDETGYDKETNDLNPYKADALTSQFGDYDTQYILDETSIPITEIAKEVSTCKLVGHNLKFDYKMGVMQGIKVRDFFDTMIAEQIIAKGSGYFFNLDAVLQRRVGILPMAKDIREGFWGKSQSSPFSLPQIQYMADDIKWLPQLKDKQVEFIERYGYQRDLYDIEFPFISLVGDAELNGFLLDEPKWKAIVAENEKILIDCKNELNAILRDLRVDHPELRKLKIDKEAKHQKVYELNLFMDPKILTAPINSSMNYGSRDQVLEIWTLLDLPKPMSNKKDQKLGYKVKKPSISAEALDAYLIEHPGTILRDFIKTLSKHSQAKTAVGTFGDRFLVEVYRKHKGKVKAQRGYKLNSTGKIYTVYRQSEAETTRMKSGRESEGFYNSQNVPKEPKYRNCFLADPGYSIITIDLSGAELVIAASLSGDLRLISYLKDGDPHSPLADFCYNKIIKYIMTTMKPYRQKMELTDLLEADFKVLGVTEKQAEEITEARVEAALRDGKFTITKETAYDIRDKFKNVNYSMIYGGSVNRIMEILNIAKEYGNIVDKGLREHLPTLFSFLEAKAKFGIANGYVQFHEDLGGRHWFKEILQARKDHRKPSFLVQGDVERACKNYPIQGTQGYMLKEASVKFYYDYVFPNNFDITPKLWVHDEHVAMAITEEADHHAKVLQKYMNEVSTKYLVGGLQMESHYTVLPYWTK